MLTITALTRCLQPAFDALGGNELEQGLNEIGVEAELFSFGEMVFEKHSPSPNPEDGYYAAASAGTDIAPSRADMTFEWDESYELRRQGVSVKRPSDRRMVADFAGNRSISRGIAVTVAGPCSEKPFTMRGLAVVMKVRPMRMLWTVVQDGAILCRRGSARY